MANEEQNGAEIRAEIVSSDIHDEILNADNAKTDRFNSKSAGSRLFFSKMLAGFVIGAGAIIPGLSGGILAVSMGLYQPTVEAVLDFFKAPRKNFKFLFPLGLGGVMGFILFMFAIEKLFSSYQTAIICLFMGLVLGTVPSFLKEANEGKPFKYSNLLFAALGFLFAFTLVLLGFFTDNAAIGRKITPLLSMLCGGIAVSGVALPGISTSFILMNMGLYDNFLQIFTKLIDNFRQNITLALFAVLGMLTVIVPMLFVVRKTLNKFHRQSYYVLFGVLISTVAGCIMQEIQRNISGVTFIQVFSCIVLLITGAIGSYFTDRAMKKLELKNELKAPSAEERNVRAN